MSFLPSPLTSNTTISAPPGPPPARPHPASFATWYFHGTTAAPPAGCSHQPNGLMRSTLPSPFTSPAPTPCAPHGPGPDTLIEIHGPSGFAGSGWENETPAALLFTTSIFPSPSTSLYALISPPASMPVATRSQRRSSLPGLTKSVAPT